MFQGYVNLDDLPDARVGSAEGDPEFEEYIRSLFESEVERESARFAFYKGYDTAVPLHTLDADRFAAVCDAVVDWEDRHGLRP